MTIQINVPDIGADEVEVTEILVNVGDTVEEEQSLITVEGDKASMEVPASQAGVVSAIKIKVGDMVSTGSLIMEFEEAAGAATPVAEEKVEEVAAPAPAAAQESAIIEINVPDIGADEVEVTEVLVNVGDTIEEEQSLITVEGDKASMEVPATSAGVVSAIKVKVGDMVSTGSLIMEFKTNAPAQAPAAAEKAADKAPAQAIKAPAASKAVAQDGFVDNASYEHASPIVRRLAREFGVNLAKVTATGPKNRIQKEDLQAYVANIVKQVESGAANGNAGAGLGLLPWPKVDFSKFGEVETAPRTKLKKISGANLHRNWVMIPHVTQWDNADITEQEAFRKAQNAQQLKMKTGRKLSPVVFVMKAVASALQAFPEFNSSLSADGESLILKKYINIGVAVDTPKGLVVPVIKDVDKKGLFELSAELSAFAKKARDGKLTGKDMQGGCFTISSLGGVGGTAFTPIINAPEVAILGLSRSSIQPKWNGEKFEPRLMLPLSLSFDHRVIDGVAGAKFITHVNNTLSDIRRLTL